MDIADAILLWSVGITAVVFIIRFAPVAFLIVMVAVLLASPSLDKLAPKHSDAKCATTQLKVSP